MKQQPTITYIKNGKEKNIRIKRINNNHIKKRIFKIYGNQLLLDEDISLIHFKNIAFEINAIKCRNTKTICIFEDCMFKQSSRNAFELQMGSFELINPNFIDIHQLNGKYLHDFNLNLSDKELSQKTELSIDISADNINLQGDFLLEKIILEGININLGNDKIPTSITLLDYGWYQSMIEGEQLNLKNCLIENLSQKSMTLESPILNIDENSCIKTNGDVLINKTFYISDTKVPRVIKKEDILNVSLLSILKTYSKLLKSKIENNTNYYLKNELSDLNEQIKIQENILNELKEKMHNEHDRKNKAIVKSLSKKSISYF